MCARFGAARDMERLIVRGVDDGGCKAASITARIDAGALAGWRADAGKDVEARVDGIGDEAEGLNFGRKSCCVGGGNAWKQQCAPGRRAQSRVAEALGEIGNMCQRLGFDAAERQANAEGCS